MGIGIAMFVAFVTAWYFLFVRGKKTDTVEEEGARLLAEARDEVV